jgi:hypothetical protein
LKRFIPVFGLLVVLACLTAGSASALTFRDETCDNSKPTCIIPDGAADTPYQFDMYARSGCPPYHYNITGGTPVPGLTLSTVNDAASGGIGRLAGTPTTSGHYLFWVTITTPESSTCLGDRADRLFEINIGGAPLAIKTSSLRNGVVGSAYTETLSASGGGSQTWSASGLPAGLSLSGNTITGTPSIAGDYTVTVSVNNGTTTKSAQYPLKVFDQLKVSGIENRVAEVGRIFATTLSATGGSGTYSWAVTDVPEGLTFDTTSHVLTGTPSVPGTYTIKVTLTDGGAGLSQPFDFPLKVAAHVAFSTRVLKAASVGKKYAVTLRTVGGAAPFKWRAFSKLPAGIKLDQRTGALLGTPIKAGTFRITLRVTDALRASSTKTFTLKVKP